MSVVGLDFGSHVASIALWYEETDKVDVIADDLGFRAIPTAVAFRADEDGVEVITGLAAVNQAHKNPKNTFMDVRALLEDENVDVVNVPALDKDISVSELASHFFRNIHSQIKQQVGKAVRDFVVSVPPSLHNDGKAKTRMIESAQAGGCRIKSTIPDSSAVLTAHQFDDECRNPSVVACVDMGWSHMEVSILTCSGGMYFPKGTATTKDMSGEAMVVALSKHCANDFKRRSGGLPCDDNRKSMTRLRNQCEEAMKSLSTGSEALIAIDSLCEGVDYQGKISKARFEDLGSIPFIHLKKCAAAALENAGLAAADVNTVIMAGGLSGMPKCQQLTKSCFPAATLTKTRGLENSEACAVGCARQAKHLTQLGLLDAPPAADAKANAPAMNSCLSLQSDAGAAAFTALPAGTVLPATYTLAGGCPAGAGSLKVLVDSKEVGEVVFAADAPEGEVAQVVATVTVAVDGAIAVDVQQPSTGLSVGSLQISA